MTSPKKPRVCQCGAPMTYYKHVRGWRCNQTGQSRENCNQPPFQEPEPEPEPEMVFSDQEKT